MGKAFDFPPRRKKYASTASTTAITTSTTAISKKKSHRQPQRTNFKPLKRALLTSHLKGDTTEPATPPPATPSASEAHRQRGNELFRERHFGEAIKAYSLAIIEDSKNPLNFLNKSLCHFKLEEYQAALESAQRAIDLDASNPKGFYRRASAEFAMASSVGNLKKLREAQRDFQEVVRLTGDADARTKLQLCQDRVREVGFAQAIASPSAPPPPRMGPGGMMTDGKAGTARRPMNYDAWKAIAKPPDSYDGPRWEDDEDNRMASPSHDLVLAIMAHLKAQKRVCARTVWRILLRATLAMDEEPNVVEVSVPETETIHVCGDVHGQYYDLLHIFEKAGVPGAGNRFLFNGDFVDRGSFSVECVLLLLSWKACYPRHFWMLRGNHESRTLNIVYGFEGEVKAKYDDALYQQFHDCFATLPLAARINRGVFVVHGGLFSRDSVTIDELNALDRRRDIPEEGLMTEMLWSDPSPTPGRAASKRGVGVLFGADVTTEFLSRNGLVRVIRSHEVKDAGYEVEHGGKLITVFSAPNYCDQLGNDAAFINLKGDLSYTIDTFKAQPHPDVKPMMFSRFASFMS